MQIRLDASSAAHTDEPDWLAPLRQRLKGGPDPEQAARLASQVLSAADPDALRRAAERPEDLVRVLFGCCSIAPFLASHLRRHPSWLLALVESELSVARDRPALEERLEAALDSSEDEHAEEALRRFKYFELARLSVRDACEELVPLDASAVTLTEISQLADVLLSAALRLAIRRVEERFGPGRWTDTDGAEIQLGFCVLGLGKLGSEELNYSSDVDLIYVHETPPGSLGEGPCELAPPAFFMRLAQEFGKLASSKLAGDFLYRVDLELRPEGDGGPLVVSNTSLASYYETSADTWEKAAFMKARPVAGDLELGWRTIRAVSPMIYRSSRDYAAVRGVGVLKEKIEAAHGASAAGFNVKIDAGGIRDLEFLAQAMQLLHGGRILQLRSRSTRSTLMELARVDLMPAAAAGELVEAYLFLRRLENRIQMREERQTQLVPAEAAARTRLATALGFTGDDALARFDEALEARRTRIGELFAAFFPESHREHIVEIFSRNASQLMLFPATRKMMENLAAHFAREIAKAPEPELALNNLDRFIGGLGGRQFYYELLLDRPELVPRLAALFGASRFLSDVLARHPRLIEPVFENPDTLLLSREALYEDLRSIRAAAGGEAPDATEERLDALRLFCSRQVVNVGLLDVSETIDRDQVEGALTEIAEVCVEEALDVAAVAAARWREDLPPAARDTRFVIVGMGKLGSREMGYGSDLDLVFLYDIDDYEVPGVVPAVQHFTVRLTQRLISVLQTPTAEGFCYEIDARMRPSGQQGSLVTSLASFRRYHETEAQVWERQALLRARPVAGDAETARAYETLRREILSRPLDEDPAEEIHRVRLRMEAELAQETHQRRDFKTGRGGVLDIESVVQYLRLRYGSKHPELLEQTSTHDQLERLGRVQLLDPDALQTLRNGWEFLRLLGSRLRIVENRSISDLDEERGDLDALARRLGYTASGRESGARRALLRDYRQHTDAVRAVYEGVFGDASERGDEA